MVVQGVRKRCNPRREAKTRAALRGEWLKRVGKEAEGKARRKKERDRDFPGAGRGGARMGRGHQHRNTIVFLTSLTGHAR